MNDGEQTKAQMATLGQEIKNLRSELHEHRVTAVEGNSRPLDPNQKARKSETRFCNYCSTNGHTPSWCRKEIRDEELKQIESQRTAEKKVTFTQDSNRKQGAVNGSEQWTRGLVFQRRNPNYTKDRPMKNIPAAYHNLSPRPKSAYGSNNPNNGRSHDRRPNQSFDTDDGHRSPNGSVIIQIANWRNTGSFSRSSARKGGFSRSNSYRQSRRSDQRNNSAFRRSENRPTTGFTSYEQKFPQNNNQKSSNVDRFTTTDDTNDELSNICSLNY